VPIDLDEYFVLPDPQPSGSRTVQAFIIPYGRTSATEADQLALFPSTTGVTGILVALTVEAYGPSSIPCPVPSMIFDPTAGSVLNIGDSFTVSFSSTIVPARVKICGRYQPQPGVNNGNDEQYTFTHTVQSGDIAGACSVLVYLTFRLGLLPVYERATGVTIDLNPKPVEGTLSVLS